jgi:hypothetical protein
MERKRTINAENKPVNSDQIKTLNTESIANRIALRTNHIRQMYQRLTPEDPTPITSLQK